MDRTKLDQAVQDFETANDNLTAAMQADTAAQAQALTARTNLLQAQAANKDKFAALKSEIESLDENGNDTSNSSASATDGTDSAATQAASGAPIAGDSAAPLPVTADAAATATA